MMLYSWKYHMATVGIKGLRVKTVGGCFCCSMLSLLLLMMMMMSD